MNKYMLFIALILTGISACRKKADTGSSSVVQLSQTPGNLGSRLVDASGNSLYYFANDANGANNCTGGCADVWPVFYAGDNLTQELIGQGLALSDFSTITTSTGKKQTTYKRWPLYYFAPPTNGRFIQEAAGATGGENINNVWFVAKPDYTIQIVSAQLLGLDGKKYKSDYTGGDDITTYFVDDKGRTLYTFKPDKFNVNTFTRQDFSNNAIWPIYETDKIVIPSALDKSLFGSIIIFGKKQLTYKGWPLYYFGEDGSLRTSNKGVSVPTPGIWPVPVKDMQAAPQP